MTPRQIKAAKRLIKKALEQGIAVGERRGYARGRAEVMAVLEKATPLNGAIADVLGVVAKAGAFDESKHPRDHGKFSSGPGADGPSDVPPPRENPHPKTRAAWRAVKDYLAEHDTASVDELTEVMYDAGVPRAKAEAVANHLYNRGLIDNDAADGHRLRLHRHHDKTADALGPVKEYLAEYGDAAPAELVEHLKDQGYSRGVAVRMLTDLHHSGALTRAGGRFRVPDEQHKAMDANPLADVIEKASKWEKDKHPRDDRGRFVSKHELAAAKRSPLKAAELRQRVTDPAERKKLDAAIGKKDPRSNAQRLDEDVDHPQRDAGGQGDHPAREQSLEEAATGAGDDFRFRSGARAAHRDGFSPANRAGDDFGDAPDESAVDGPADPHAAAVARIGNTETAIRHHLKSGHPDRHRAIAKLIQGHTVAELRVLRDRLGVGTVTGRKADIVAAIAARAAGTPERAAELMPAARMTVDEAERHVRGLLATGGLRDIESRRELAHILQHRLRVSDIHELKGRLGLKASGPKKELADKVATRAGELHGLRAKLRAARERLGGREYDFPASNTAGAFRAKVEHTPDGKAVITQAENGRHVLTVPSDVHDRFIDELSGRISGRPGSGHAAVDAVLSGKGKFLGKGHEGQVFDAGDGSVVKAAVVTPFHWNNGLRTPGEANTLLTDAADTTNKLVAAGVPGLLPQTVVHHDGRAYVVAPKVDTSAPLTPDHLTQLEETLRGMHAAGYHLADDVQFGVGPDGRATIFDTGSVRKLPASRPEDDIRHDFNNLQRLAKQHNVPFTHPDFRGARSQYENALFFTDHGKLSRRDALKHRNKLNRLRDMVKDSDPEFHELSADAHDDAVKQLEAVLATPPAPPVPQPAAAADPGGVAPAKPWEMPLKDLKRYHADVWEKIKRKHPGSDSHSYREYLSAAHSRGFDVPLALRAVHLPGTLTSEDRAELNKNRKTKTDVTAHTVPRAEYMTHLPNVDYKSNAHVWDKIVSNPKAMSIAREIAARGAMTKADDDATTSLGLPSEAVPMLWAAGLHEQAHRNAVAAEIDRGKFVSDRVLADYPDLKDKQDWYSNNAATYWDSRARRTAVADALAAGKPVPPEVMADYPDLAGAATPPAPAAPAPAPPARPENPAAGAPSRQSGTSPAMAGVPAPGSPGGWMPGGGTPRKPPTPPPAPPSGDGPSDGTPAVPLTRLAGESAPDFLRRFAADPGAAGAWLPLAEAIHGLSRPEIEAAERAVGADPAKRDWTFPSTHVFNAAKDLYDAATARRGHDERVARARRILDAVASSDDPAALRREWNDTTDRLKTSTRQRQMLADALGVRPGPFGVEGPLDELFREAAAPALARRTEARAAARVSDLYAKPKDFGLAKRDLPKTPPPGASVRTLDAMQDTRTGGFPGRKKGDVVSAGGSAHVVVAASPVLQVRDPEHGVLARRQHVLVRPATPDEVDSAGAADARKRWATRATPHDDYNGGGYQTDAQRVEAEEWLRRYAADPLAAYRAERAAAPPGTAATPAPPPAPGRGVEARPTAAEFAAASTPAGPQPGGDAAKAPSGNLSSKLDNATATGDTTGVGPRQGSAPNTPEKPMNSQPVTREFRTPSGMRPRYQGSAHELVHQHDAVPIPKGSVRVQTLRTAVNPRAEEETIDSWTKANGRGPSTDADRADIAARLRNGEGMGLFRVGLRFTGADGRTIDQLVSEHDTAEDARAAADAKHADLQKQAVAAGGK